MTSPSPEWLRSQQEWRRWFNERGPFFSPELRVCWVRDCEGDPVIEHLGTGRRIPLCKPCSDKLRKHGWGAIVEGAPRIP